MIDAMRAVLLRLSARPVLSMALVFAVALLSRVAMAFWMPNEIAWEDGFRYVKVADNLLSGQGFGGIWDNYRSVPTQPLLLALLIVVMGKSYLAFRLAFAVLGAVSCVLGAALGKRLFGAPTGLLAGLLLSVYPPLIYLGVLFEYPQALFILLMTLFFLLLYDYRERGGWWRVCAAGLFLGASILTVPTVLDYVPLVVGCLWLMPRRPFAVPALLLLMFTALPVGAWALRNYDAYGQVILVNKSAGINFWAGNSDNYYRYGKAGVVPECGPGFEFTSFCRGISETAERVLKSKVSDLEAVNEYDRDAWERGMAYIRESPSRFVVMSLRKFGLYWSQLPDAVDANDWNAPRGRTLALVASYFPVMLLAVAAAWLLRRRFLELSPIYLYALAMSAPYSVMLPVTRYRIPIEFMAIILAAYAVNRLVCRDRIEQGRK